MNVNDLTEKLPPIVDLLVDSIVTEPGMQHLGRVFLPSRDAIIQCIGKLQQLVFPGYFGKQGLTVDNVQYHVGELLQDLAETMYEQVRCCLRYREHLPTPDNARPNTEGCDSRAGEITKTFLERIPAVRTILATDVRAAFDGDPAARNTDETIFCYPGVFAIMVQRLAHELFKLEVPLLPRIMTEYAHGRTGIDIHPGAKLGESFFIDHGTGVVIGETTEIGRNVKVYQGVTLGALAPAMGQVWRGRKRHPTIEDDVVIYAGATILGGDTVIGKGAVINGNVFLTDSVQAGTIVGMEPPKLIYRTRRPRKGPESA
jgi:serine O-acetyltransferase